MLLVEDHPLVRRLIRTLCEERSDLEVVGEVGEGRAAVEAVDSLVPDVVVLDLGLPGGDGLEIAGRMRERHPRIRLLVLSAHTEPDVVLGAIRAGVDGYLDKGAPTEEIVDAVRAVADGGRIFSPELEKRAMAGLGSLARRTRETARWLELLTEREREILQLIARGSSTDETAAELHLSERTIRAHLTELYRKLGVKGRVEAIGLAARLGLVELGDPDPSDG